MGASAQFDVCIVGSGFGGGVLASALAATGKRIAIVEAGDWEDRAATQRSIAEGLGPPPSPPELHTPISVHGNIGIGRGWTFAVGGHGAWTAWALRGLESQFRMRTLYGVGEDWPITYDELEPYYCRAEDELGVSGDSDAKHGPRRSRPYPMPPFPFSYGDAQYVKACNALGIEVTSLPMARNRVPRGGRVACCFSGKCDYCPTTAKYRPDLVHVPSATAAKNVTLLKRHVGMKLVLDERGRVARLDCALPDRSTTSVAAGTFVVACNTVESTRLLLASAQDGHPNGLGNRSGVLGRYLADHMLTTMDGLAPAPLWSERTARAVLCRQFEDGEHRKERAGFLFSVSAVGDPTAEAMHARAEGLFGVALKKRIGLIARAATMRGVSELLPYPDNRVELDPSVRDHFGRPAIKLTMSYGDYEERGRKAMYATFRSILEKMGCTDLVPSNSFGSGNHLLGTLRMGADAKRSVVDRNLRTHDVENLYCATSAVFPNSLGPANPTLTLVSLSLRLSDHLRKEVLR